MIFAHRKVDRDSYAEPELSCAVATAGSLELSKALTWTECRDKSEGDVVFCSEAFTQRNLCNKGVTSPEHSSTAAGQDVVSMAGPPRRTAGELHRGDLHRKSG